MLCGGLWGSHFIITTDNNVSTNNTTATAFTTDIRIIAATTLADVSVLWELELYLWGRVCEEGSIRRLQFYDLELKGLRRV